VHRHEHRRGERRRGRAGFHQQRDLDGVPTPAVVRSVVLNSIWLCCIHSFATIDYSTVSCFERKSMELRWLISSRQTEDKTTGCNSVTTQSQLSHNSVTTQSQLSHNSVTTQSQFSHNSVTTQSQLSHSSQRDNRCLVARRLHAMQHRVRACVAGSGAVAECPPGSVG
jgi:hypothetical protein